MVSIKSHEYKGKIAFMYSAIRASDSTPVPVLNMKFTGSAASLVMCIGFLDLNNESAYLTNMTLLSPSGEKVITSYRMAGIPPENIDQESKSTFLSANMSFRAEESGVYSFHCELWENLASKVDEKTIHFNIFIESVKDE